MAKGQGRKYVTKIGMYLLNEFEVIDDDYLRVRNRIDGIDRPVIITDEVMLLLIFHYEPFFREILSQLIRKAFNQSRFRPMGKSSFSIAAVKKEVFVGHIKKSGRQEIIVIAVDNSGSKKGVI